MDTDDLDRLEALAKSVRVGWWNNAGESSLQFRSPADSTYIAAMRPEVALDLIALARVGLAHQEGQDDMLKSAQGERSMGAGDGSTLE